MAGEIPRIPLNLVLLKGVIVRGMEMRSIMDAVPDLVLRDQRSSRSCSSAGKIHPHVSAVYPLADTPAALRSMLSAPPPARSSSTPTPDPLRFVGV